jgi:response regulator RpfG family c-di-GMP phosphodiesterase
MSQNMILIVDDEPEILDILEILIESEFDVQLIRAKSGNEAIEHLKKYEDIKLIISDYTMSDGSGGDLFNYNKSEKNLPFILVSGGFIQDYKDMTDLFTVRIENGFIQKPVDDSKLFSLIRAAVKFEEDSDDSCDSSSEFKKVNIIHAIYFLERNRDIYLNIGKKKFLKVINEGELTCTDQLQRYKEKGENYIYILKNDFDFYVKEILSNLEVKIKNSSTFSDTITIGALGYEFVHSSLVDMGLTKEHVELLNGVVDKCVKNLMKKPKVEVLLNSFFKEKGYLVSHSLTCVYTSFMICSYLDYANESVIEKLVYASLLHDLGLTDKNLSEVINCNDDKFKSLQQRDQKQVLNHMFESVKLLEGFDMIPNDVENIIAEHHENASGTGFPRGLSASRLAPLSAVFILSLRFSHFLYFNEFKSGVDDFIEDLQSNYNKGSFKKPLAGLITSIKKAL